MTARSSNRWPEVSLSDVASPSKHAFSTGPFGSAISSKFFVDTGVPVLRGSNLSEEVGQRLVEDSLVFLSHEKAAEFERSHVMRGDLVFTCWGTVGQVGLIDSRSHYNLYVISNKQMKLTPASERADSLFLYYALSSPSVVGKVKNQAIGSSVPGFNLGQLKHLQVPLPPLREQQAIAGTLGALDDKIELNRRMNRTLEGIAQTLFRAWFVDFEGETDLVESELGPIPRGWEAASLGEEFRLTMGQSPPGSTYNEYGEGLPFYQGATDFGFRYPDLRVFCSEPKRIAEVGDTLVSVRAPVGRVNRAATRCCIGRGVAALRHRSGSESYTYMAAKQLEERFERFNAEGTVFGSIGKKDFHRIPVLRPPAAVVERYTQVVEPLDKRLKIATGESRALAELRDTLLPKLISGEIRVPEVEEAVEEAV